MIGSFATVRLPDGLTTEIGWRRPDPIQRRLSDDYGIEVTLMSWPAALSRIIRVSASQPNDRENDVRLAATLEQELAAERAAAAAARASR